jgi:hypothetical protein
LVVLEALEELLVEGVRLIIHLLKLLKVETMAEGEEWEAVLKLPVQQTLATVRNNITPVKPLMQMAGTGQEEQFVLSGLETCAPSLQHVQLTSNIN